MTSARARQRLKRARVRNPPSIVTFGRQASLRTVWHRYRGGALSSSAGNYASASRAEEGRMRSDTIERLPHAGSEPCAARAIEYRPVRPCRDRHEPCGLGCGRAGQQYSSIDSWPLLRRGKCIGVAPALLSARRQFDANVRLDRLGRINRENIDARDGLVAPACARRLWSWNPQLRCRSRGHFRQIP